MSGRNRFENDGMVTTALTHSTLDALTVDPVLDSELAQSTEPLVVTLKNSDRLDSLRVNLRATTSVVFTASPVARILRRDWNLVCAKLFLNALDPEYAKKIQENVIELSWQTQDLSETVGAMPFGELDLSWMRPRKLELQIIHPLAGRWLHAFQRYDEAFSILINAQKAGKLTPKQRWSLTSSCQLSYIGFKAIAMKLPLKTATELLEQESMI